MKKLPEELRDKYMSNAEQYYISRLMGFSVNPIELSERAFEIAEKHWESDGYYLPPAKIINLKEREEDFAKKVLP